MHTYMYTFVSSVDWIYVLSVRFLGSYGQLRKKIFLRKNIFFHSYICVFHR